MATGGARTAHSRTTSELTSTRLARHRNAAGRDPAVDQMPFGLGGSSPPGSAAEGTAITGRGRIDSDGRQVSVRNKRGTMSNTFSKLRSAALLAAVALAATGCDPGGDAESAQSVQTGSAAVIAKGGDDAFGTDQSVEDSDLTTKVREAIFADARLQSQHIEVETEDAAVTLTGVVDSPSLRERAVELAGSVDGVAQVQDRLKVRS